MPLALEDPRELLVYRGTGLDSRLKEFCGVRGLSGEERGKRGKKLRVGESFYTFRTTRSVLA